MVAKKAPAKKAAKKAAPVKAKYYGSVLTDVVNVEDGSPIVSPLKLTDKESIAYAEENPNYIEITKGQFDKLVDYLEGAVFGPAIQQISELDRDGKRTAGDWIMDILICTTGFALGALLF